MIDEAQEIVVTGISHVKQHPFPQTANALASCLLSASGLLLQKLADYGTSDLTEPEQILQRLTEKIGRMRNILKRGGNNQVKDEPLIQTAQDIIGYGAILECLLNGRWGLEEKVGSEGKPILADPDHHKVKTVHGINMGMPKYEGDVGYDLIVSEDTVIPPLPAMPVIIPSEVAIAMPEGYWCQIVGRSSAANKRGLLVHTAVIDNGYRNKLFACTWNMTDQPVLVKAGERIAQVVFLPIHTPECVEVQSLPESERNLNGFGSTGK